MPQVHPPASVGDATRATTTDVFDVSVIVVTYNVRGFLEQALESVERASAGLTVETFVVDNDSADGSAAMVRERFPHVTLIANDVNVGFATANNQAIRQARGRQLLILNPDTLLQEDTLRELVSFMDEHPEAGAAGCRILNPDGTFAPESRRAFPTPAVAFYRISGLSRLFPKSERFGRYNLTHLPIDQVCEVDALSGSCMMVRRDAVDHKREDPEAPGAGLLDEAFFMYGEDLDWCYRIQQAGWRIYYTPQTQLVHYKGESTKAGDMRYVVLFYGAMLRFVEKHVQSRPDASVLDRLGSALLSVGLRLGIVTRATIAAGSRVGRAIGAPLADLVVSWIAIALAVAGWAAAHSFSFSIGYYALVAPAYALVLGVSVLLAGGYSGSRVRIRPVLAGAALAIVAVASVSYFAPDVAFSRAAVLLGFGAAGLALISMRLFLRRRAAEPRRAVLVGSASEAERLRRLTGRRSSASVEIVGYVSDATSSTGEIAHVGLPRQLRDVVRLQKADDVVFAADSLTNTAILNGMRTLRDAPVHLKILASGRDRIIGKASVEDLSAPLLDAQRTVAPLRPRFSRRAVEIPAALLLLAIRPFLRLRDRSGVGADRPARLATVAAGARDVLAGRRALIGYHESDARPPEAWGLSPAVVSVLDTLPERPGSIVEAHRAYWFYARHQSVWLDLDILFHALLRRR